MSKRRCPKPSRGIHLATRIRAAQTPRRGQIIQHFQHGLRQNMGERMPKPINFGSGIESVTGHDVREWQASGLGGGIHWRGNFLRNAFR